MENSKATINVYDYGRNYSLKKKFSLFITKIVEMIFLIGIVSVVGYSIYKYFNDDALEEIDKMATYSVQNIYNYIINNNIQDEYKIVYFPDEENIVGSNGLVNNNLGIEINQFESGYIIMYKDGKYSYELNYNGYCVSKDIEDAKYKINIFRKCDTHKMDYLKG